MPPDLGTSPPPPASAAPRPATIAVLGLGYVGLPVVMTFAGSGFEVVGIDVDADRVRDLCEVAISEPPAVVGTCEQKAGRIVFTTDTAELRRADVVFICVPTPFEDGEAQHNAVRDCAAAFARHGRADALVILESTVRPGFVEQLRPLLGHEGDVALAYAPERIDPGRACAGSPLREIARVVAGVDEASLARAVSILCQVGVTVHPVPLRVAEYAKLLENAYRLLNVAFIDEFAALCRTEGIDARSVVEAAATKPFGFQSFWPGVGAGGHCVAVDPTFLVHQGQRLNRRLAVLEQALESNARRPFTVAATVSAATAPGDVILVVGLTYKPGISDTRESAALVAARALVSMNRRVIVFDALVPAPSDLEGVPLDLGLERASAAVLLVSQSEAVVAALKASAIILFDATGTVPDAVEV